MKIPGFLKKRASKGSMETTRRTTHSGSSVSSGVPTPAAAPAQSADVRAADRSINFGQVKDTAGPILLLIASFLMNLDDYIRFVYEKWMIAWNWLQPYHPQELVPAFVGLLMVFFGGVYAVLIAAIEAANMFGMRKVITSLKLLYGEFEKARIAYEKDEKEDLNKDGKADVTELNPQQLVFRKVKVILRTVDPELLSAALEGLTQAWVAIIATLRVKFAQAITLGTSIGNNLYRYTSPFIIKLLSPAMPPEYRKWLPILLQYSFRYVGVALAFKLVRIVSAVFVGMKGSEVFFFGVTQYLVRHKYVPADFAEAGNSLIMVAYMALAIFGAVWQIKSNFSLPFPLNILLLPLTIAEKILMLSVGSKGLPSVPVEKQ